VEFLEATWQFRSDTEIADVLTGARGQLVRHDVVRLKRRGEGWVKTATGVPRIFQESGYVRYDKPPVVESDNVLVLADVEAPFHDAEWCSDVVALAKCWGIGDVILAGDFLHFASLSGFTKQLLAGRDGYEFAEDAEVEVSDEVEAAARFSDVLLDNFQRIVFILGNHEKRLSKRLAVSVRVQLLRQLLGYRREERFEVYPYYFALVKASTGTWRITHPGNASVIPVRVACRLADKYRMHVVAGHGHDFGEATSVSGYYAAATGCCVDPERLAYSALRDNVQPVMQRGAWILRDGYPVLLHPSYRPPRLWLGVKSII